MDTESKAEAAKVDVETTKAVKTKPLPKKIKMTMMWGFIDDDGNNHLWRQWQTVTDPDEIKMIMATTEHYKVLE